MPETVNPNESTETLPLQPEITTDLKILPKFCYCPQCNQTVFESGIEFVATISGGVSGTAWFENYSINHEYEDDDYSYTNHEYTCANCRNNYQETETMLDEEVHKTTELLEKIRDYCASQNISGLRTEANQVSSILNGRSNNTMYIHPQTGNGFMISVQVLPTREQPETRYEILLHPKIYEFVKTHANENEEYAFDFDNPIYSEVYEVFNQALNQYTEENRRSRETPSPNPYDGLADNALRFYQNPGNLGRLNHTPEGFVVRSEEYINDDPMQSQTVERSHHRRWNDNDLSHICTCVHCMYSFECEPELNLVICPKCNKETENALNQ